MAADEHQETTTQPSGRPSAARVDRETVLSGLAKFREGGSKLEDLTDRDPHGDQADDTDDHGDDEPAPARKPTKRPAARHEPDLDDEDDDEDESDEPDLDDDDDEAAEVEAVDEDEDEGDELDEDAAAPAAKPDPELERRAAALRKQEKRQRDASTRERADIARERAEFTREREQHRADIEEVREYKALRARAKYDPAGVLAKLGLTEDDFEPAARQLYSRSKTALADPKTRAQAEAAQQQRELHDKTSKNEEELAKLRNEITQRDQVAEAERQVSRYVTSIANAVPDVKGAELVRRAMKRAPERTKAHLSELALELARTTGELPSVKRVIRESERRRREALEESGVDLATVIKHKPPASGDATTDKRPASGAKKPEADGAGKPPKDRDAMKDDLLAEIKIARKKKLLA